VPLSTVILLTAAVAAGQAGPPKPPDRVTIEQAVPEPGTSLSDAVILAEAVEPEAESV
jgi:hypothetical protein